MSGLPNPQKLIGRTQTVIHTVNPPMGSWGLILSGEVRRWSLEFVPGQGTSYMAWPEEDATQETGYIIISPATLMLEFAKQLDWLSRPWFGTTKIGGVPLSIVETLILGSTAADMLKEMYANVYTR